MATVGGAGRYRTNGAVYARDAWNAVRRHSTTVSERVWTFLAAFPALVQGVYFMLTGIWPVVHLSSFLAVTGHKTDTWLVQTLGLLIFVVGAALCVAAYRREKSAEIAVLALGSAAALAGVDVYFVFNRTISAVYLLDAVLEVAIIFVWLYAWYGEARDLARATPPASVPAAPATYAAPPANLTVGPNAFPAPRP